jgi:hypothetical protein
MGSTTPGDQIVTALVSIITALTSAVTAASTSGAAALTLANLATSINNQGTNDAGMTATEKDLLSKIATAIQATSPTSSIRNSVYAS